MTSGISPPVVLAERIVVMHDDEGLSYQKIADILEREVCEREGRQFSTSAFAKRTWTKSKVRKRYDWRWGKHLQQNE